MGFTEVFADFYAAFSTPEVHADAPEQQEEENEEGAEERGEDKGEDGEGVNESAEGGDEEAADEGGDEEEAEEEEEEEELDPEDPKPRLEAECERSAQCASFKHHFDDCAERVQEQHENPDHKGPKEDCVEEFFHLQHCAAQCAAPKLFRMLK